MTTKRKKPSSAPVIAIDTYFSKIKSINPKLNAFITICDNAKAKGSRQSVLYNLPVAVKDLYDTKGIRTTGGSKFFEHNIPQTDSVVVQKIKGAGAVIIGKTNTHEIALGVTNNNPHFGACRNPWDSTRIPGGSSGGSAVAVATGMAWGALGTDTGGSIRIPASLCGVVGLKPTYGRVSLRGVMPLSWNVDHAGPITKTVKDAALLLQVIAGYDIEDPSSINVPVDHYLGYLRKNINGLRLGWIDDDYTNASDADVLKAVRSSINIFKDAGATVKKISVPWLGDAALNNSIITQADGAAFHRERLQEKPEWFGADVRLRLETGARFTSSEYSLARRKQVQLKRRSEHLFETVDLLLLPTTPISAPVLEGENAIERARQLTRFTAPFNLTGLPALSIPCGFSADGLPIGLQIIGAHWNEGLILQAGNVYEKATEWHKQSPII